MRRQLSSTWRSGTKIADEEKTGSPCGFQNIVRLKIQMFASSPEVWKIIYKSSGRQISDCPATLPSLGERALGWANRALICQ